ncbi:MAG: DUF3307 domain-containing protein [Bacteroidota bacterium]
MEVFLRLLIAHIITDFFIQPDKWVADKKQKKIKSKYLYLHVLITGIAALIALWDIKLWYIALFIAITHYFIDVIKIVWCKDNLLSFLLDQALHITILILCANYLMENNQIIDQIAEKIKSTNSLLILTGYMIVSQPLGYLVGKATNKWRQELNASSQERDSLKDAGMWIGIMERILVLTFVLYNQFQAIGFLIAAKSILRFSDKSDSNPSKQTEYVLIGTLISFTTALFIGILIQKLQAHV